MRSDPPSPHRPTPASSSPEAPAAGAFATPGTPGTPGASATPPSGATPPSVHRQAKVDWRVRAAVVFGVTLIRLLGLTWRIRVVNFAPTVAARREGKALVFSLWHGELFPLLWQHRNEGARVLISEHRDGEIVARVAEALGFGITVRGSTSRGGGRALLEMVRVLREGYSVAVTPDGPRGPARRYAPGALVAAHRAGAPVVCVAVHASSGWRLRSWDSFLIPRPFARVTFAYTAPELVPAESVRDAAGLAPHFEARHEEAARAARAAAASPATQKGA